MAWHIVGHGTGEYIGKGSARDPEHRLRLLAEGQRLQRGALEFDHEFPHSLWPWLAWLAAIAQTCRDAAREIGRKRLAGGPIKAIGQRHAGPGHRCLPPHP